MGGSIYKATPTGFVSVCSSCRNETFGTESECRSEANTFRSLERILEVVVVEASGGGRQGWQL